MCVYALRAGGNSTVFREYSRHFFFSRIFFPTFNFEVLKLCSN